MGFGTVIQTGTIGRPLARSPGARLLALFLCGVALRPQVTGVAPLLPALERDLRLSHALAGLLTTLPLACMGGFALAGMPLARALGSRLAVAASLLLLTAAGALRAASPLPPTVVLLTLGVGIGIALAGTVLPQVVKESFAEHPVRGTGTYSAGIQVGSTMSAAVAVPLALAFGSWRGSLFTFAGLTFLVLAAWLIAGPPPGGVSQIVSGKKGHGPSWTVGLLAATFALFSAAYYGLITWLPEIYLQHGWSAVATGGLLGVLNGAAMAGGFAVALLAGRRRASPGLVLGLAACFAAAISGLALLPGAAIVWAVAAGAANGALLPLVLALPLELSPDPATAATASAVVVGVGYTVAAVVPAAFGGVRDLTGGFDVVEALLLGIGWAFALTAALACTRKPGLEVRR